MGLFDKRTVISAVKNRALGNRKLDDGNLCKNCASKLSPWFEERRHSTVEDIKDSWHTEKKTRMLFATSVLPVSFLQTDIMCLSTITKECLP